MTSVVLSVRAVDVHTSRGARFGRLRPCVPPLNRRWSRVEAVIVSTRASILTMFTCSSSPSPYLYQCCVAPPRAYTILIQRVHDGVFDHPSLPSLRGVRSGICPWHRVHGQQDKDFYPVKLAKFARMTNFLPNTHSRARRPTLRNQFHRTAAPCSINVYQSTVGVCLEITHVYASSPHDSSACWDRCRKKHR